MAERRRTPMVPQVACRVCSAILREGGACEHIRMEPGGGVYLEHPGHAMEPDPYSPVAMVPADSEPGPADPLPLAGE